MSENFHSYLMISSTVIRQKSCEKNQNADEERKVAKLNFKKLDSTFFITYFHLFTKFVHYKKEKEI